MAEDEDKPEAPGSKGVARRPPGAATRRFAGYRIDELTEALACYEEAFGLYARALADALEVWLAGKRSETDERLKDDEQLKADEQAFHRQEAFRRAVIAVVTLGKRLGL